MFGLVLSLMENFLGSSQHDCNSLVIDTGVMQFFSKLGIGSFDIGDYLGIS